MRILTGTIFHIDWQRRPPLKKIFLHNKKDLTLINFDYTYLKNKDKDLAHISNVKNEYLKNVDNFVTSFKNSPIPSIDRFLNINKPYVCYGKLGIIYRILTCEAKSPEKFEYHRAAIPNDPSITIDKMDWFSAVFNKMIEGINNADEIDKFSDNRISFISFNYDRYLEEFFYNYLTNTFIELTKDKIISVIRTINIKHVYGIVAPCMWEENGLNFRAQIGLRQVEEYSGNILLIDERKKCSKSNFGDIFSSSKRVFFLGFGFAKENLEVLGFPDNFCQDYEYYGTAYKMTGKETHDAIRSISGLDPVELEVKNKIILKDTDCLTLLRNYF